VTQNGALVQHGWIKVDSITHPSYKSHNITSCLSNKRSVYSGSDGLYCWMDVPTSYTINLLDGPPAPPAPPAAATPKPEVNPNVICKGKPVKTPRSCSIRAGRVKLSKLSWLSWGYRTSKATGKVSIDGSKLRTATITLSRPMPSTYTRMTIKMAHGKTRHLALRSN
jgi:hypothetical protein